MSSILSLALISRILKNIVRVLDIKSSKSFVESSPKHFTRDKPKYINVNRIANTNPITNCRRQPFATLRIYRGPTEVRCKSLCRPCLG